MELRNLVCTPEELDSYLSACEPVPRGQFYQGSEASRTLFGSGISPVAKSDQSCVSGKSDGARAGFSSPQGLGSPTVIFLHALMSASDVGYRRIAARLNRRGWKRC